MIKWQLGREPPEGDVCKWFSSPEAEGLWCGVSSPSCPTVGALCLSSCR